jgi:hypothetical protein
MFKSFKTFRVEDRGRVTHDGRRRAAVNTARGSSCSNRSNRSRRYKPIPHHGGTLRLRSGQTQYKAPRAEKGNLYQEILRLCVLSVSAVKNQEFRHDGGSTTGDGGQRSLVNGHCHTYSSCSNRSKRLNKRRATETAHGQDTVYGHLWMFQSFKCSSR